MSCKRKVKMTAVVAYGHPKGLKFSLLEVLYLSKGFYMARGYTNGAAINSTIQVGHLLI